MKVVFCCAEDEMPGVCYISAVLKKKGHTVDLVFDPKQFDRAYIRNEKLAHYFHDVWLRDNLEKIGKINPDIVGFSCTTAHYQWALTYAVAIKKHFPHIYTIFGGEHSTVMPESVIKEKCVDFVCIGEGEEAMSELLEQLEKGDKSFRVGNLWAKDEKGNVIQNQLRNLIQDLDSLPFADKELFKDHLPSNYFTEPYAFTSRGCPYICTYCGVERMKKVFAGKGNFVRRNSPKRAIAELLELKNKHGAKYILFEDDVFAMNEKWMTEFAPLYKKKIGLPFAAFGHTQLLTPNMVKLLKKAGCDFLWFGLQSASEKIRREVHARFERNEEVIRAFDLCHKADIKTMVDHICNVPYETHESIYEAFHLYNRIRPNIINVYNLLYFPKAKINEIALQAGLITEKDIKKINEGKFELYQAGNYSDHRKNFYNKYALVISCIPLMPSWLVSKIAGSEKLVNFFSRLPPHLIPIVKIIVNFKSGRGFLPLAILKIEIYYAIQFLKVKINKLFKQYTYNPAKVGS